MTPRLTYASALAAVLVGVVLLRLWDPAPVARLRALAFDVFQQLAPRSYDPGLPVRIIDVDDESLKRVGQWPWPRTSMASMVAKLHRLGAATIAFDVVFPEPDRLSPEQLIAGASNKQALRKLLAEMGELRAHDQVFAEAIAEAPVVLGFIATAARSERLPEIDSGFATAGDDPLLFVPRFGGAASSLPALQRAAKGAGSLNWLPEHDQILRRMPLLIGVGGELAPSLAVDAVRVAQGASTIIVKSSGASGEEAFGAETGVNRVRVGEFIIPTDANGRMLLHFTPSTPARFIPAWRLLADQVTADQVAGRIILIGTSAAGLFDLRTTPLDSAVPGVELQAQAVEQILLGTFLRRPDFAMPAELAYILVLGLSIGFLIHRLGALAGAALAAAAVVAVVALSWLAFTRLGWLVDPVYPAAALTAVYLTGTLIAFLRTEGERNRVRHAFGHYMAPAMVEKLAADPNQLKLGGEMREMTLLFSDVRGFTSISENLDAEELTRFVNRLFSPLSNIIIETKGTIDKYMGDALMAFWNAPLDDPEHARNGCLSALRMQSRMASLDAELRRELVGLSGRNGPIEIGIGLNTGACCVGNLGSEQRFDYSVIGDNVNVAARLEGQTKTYGVRIIVGEATVAQAPGFAFLETDLITVKGKTEAVRVYTLLGDESVATSSGYRELETLHGRMLASYRSRDWDAAKDLLARCEAIDELGLERLYRLYRNRIAAFERTPPPAGWDGSTVAVEK